MRVSLSAFVTFCLSSVMPILGCRSLRENALVAGLLQPALAPPPLGGRWNLMRLLVSGMTLLAPALDLRFGHADAALDIAGMVAGALVALPVITDYLWLDPPAHGGPSRRSAELREP